MSFRYPSHKFSLLLACLLGFIIGFAAPRIGLSDNQPENASEPVPVIELVSPEFSQEAALIEGHYLQMVEMEADLSELMDGMTSVEEQNTLLYSELEEYRFLEEVRDAIQGKHKELKIESIIGRINEWFSLSPEQQAILEAHLIENNGIIRLGRMRNLLQETLSEEQLKQLKPYLRFEDYNQRDMVATKRVGQLQEMLNLTKAQKNAFYDYFYNTTRNYPPREVVQSLQTESGINPKDPAFRELLREYIIQDNVLRANSILTPEQVQTYQKMLNFQLRERQEIRSTLAENRQSP